MPERAVRQGARETGQRTPQRQLGKVVTPSLPVCVSSVSAGTGQQHTATTAFAGVSAESCTAPGRESTGAKDKGSARAGGGGTKGRCTPTCERKHVGALRRERGASVLPSCVDHSAHYSAHSRCNDEALGDPRRRREVRAEVGLPYQPGSRLPSAVAAQPLALARLRAPFAVNHSCNLWAGDNARSQASNVRHGTPRLRERPRCRTSWSCFVARAETEPAGRRDELRCTAQHRPAALLRSTARRQSNSRAPRPRPRRRRPPRPSCPPPPLHPRATAPRTPCPAAEAAAPLKVGARRSREGERRERGWRRA